MAMTKEGLDLWTRLQPTFNRLMGPWQVGAHCFCLRIKLQGIVVSIANTSVRVEFENGDCVYRSIKGIRKSSLIRLPLDIDRNNPERGLWGMINSFHKRLEEICTGYEYHRYWEFNDYTHNKTFRAETSTLALLRALGAQEGV